MRAAHPRLLAFLVPLTVAVLTATTAAAAPTGTVPAMAGQPGSHLAARVLAYDGHTNGGMKVEVTNGGRRSESFVAQGLFFVPEGSPNEAPQRLGAVGPFQVDGRAERKDSIELEPGARVVLLLDVYCIDSHRHSPTPETRFHLAAERMPRDLSTGISSSAQEAARSYGGVSAPAAKGAVQSEVWKNRDKKWIKLEGEGAQESGK